MRLTEAISMVIAKDDPFIFSTGLTVNQIKNGVDDKKYDLKSCVIGMNDDSKITVYPPTMGTGARYANGKWDNKPIETGITIDSF